MLQKDYHKRSQSGHLAEVSRDLLQGLEKRLEGLFVHPWGSSIATFCGLTSFVIGCSKYWGALVNVIDPNLTDHFGPVGSKTIEYIAVYGISGLLELGLTIPATYAVFKYYKKEGDKPATHRTQKVSCRFYLESLFHRFSEMRI